MPGGLINWIEMKVIKSISVACLAVCLQSATAAISLAADTVDADIIASEGPANEALRAFQNGKFDEAVRLATPLADSGVADALYLLGFAHETGNGAPQSREKAMEFHRKAMEKGQSDSAYRLSFLLMASEEKAERDESREILERKAVTDVAVAGRILGEGYLLGRFGEEADVKKGSEWWEKTAEAGDVASMLLLARLYEGQMGFAESVDIKKSAAYYLNAAEKGNPAAMVAVGSRLLNNSDEAARDEKKGREWLQKAIAEKEFSAHLVLGDFEENIKNDPGAALPHYERGKDAKQLDCTLRAAEFYLTGRGTEKDVDRGLNLLKSAAEEGSGHAHFRLAVHEMNNDQPEVLKGYGHLVTAANTGIVEAQNELGLFYLSGALATADISAAISWFTRAAQAGFAAAQNNLAALHERGAGVPQNFANAGRLYEMASNQGHPSATLALARLYAAGAGTEKNLERAWALATLAGEVGEENAKEIIEEIAKSMNPEQLAAAKKELERIKSGEPAEEKK